MHVEGDAAVAAQRGLHQRGARRKGLVGRRCGKNNEIDRTRLDAGRGNRLARRFGCEAGGRLIVAGDVAVTNAGALDNPLVAGIDGLGQFIVGDGSLGQVRARAD